MNIKELIDRKLDEDNKKIVSIVSKVADELNYKAYLVGGIVRDFFTCRKNFDIDIVIEGELCRLTKALEKKIFIKKVKFMQDFLTAKVYLKQKHIDISTARKETYPLPAVLPHVEPAGDIEEDLGRRDFGINAMAVCINKEYYGQLIDKFGGIEDIRKKKIKILHQESFIDDPTRIFRAVRYATRYKYHIERNTLSLIKNCIKLGIPRLLSWDRIKNEIVLLLKEDMGEGMMRLWNLGLFNLLDLNFNIKKEDIRDVFRRIELVGGGWVEKFMYLLDGLMEDDIEKILNFLKFESIILKKLRNIRNLSDILENLKRATKNSQLFHSLIPLPNEFILYMLAKFYKNYVIRKKLLHYLDLKNTESLISGEDLINIGLHPSPLFKKILNEIRELQLDGVLKDKRDAELYIMEKYKA